MFKLLGPLEVTAGPDRLDLGGTRQQIVVATLLISANRMVTMDRLLEAIYGEGLPPTSRAQAQISISSLRRMFASHSDEEIISTREHGYVIRVGRGQLDSEQFQELVTAARAARDAGQPSQAVASYRDALRLWRGPALDGIDSQLVRAAASRLDEQRIATNEDRLKLELDLGRHHELVGELTELVHDFPLREQLRGLLMLALYRCDRTAEALEAYRQTRHTMIDELGIEPGTRLQNLQHDILSSDPSLSLPAEQIRIPQFRQQIPNLLPTDIADFTGREEQLSQIRQRLVVATAQDVQQAVPVVVILGKGGVGKTALAVHAAHSVAGHFDGGLLFADLHGGSSHLVGPRQVLERFLRALGVPAAQMPRGLDERAEVYRSLVADRKVLVVLDDAASESQVSPLLPGGGPAGVIITSRRGLTGLAGATQIPLDVFDTDKSLDLLARIAGAARIQADPEAATMVATHCGRLPLALRIAGARLSARPHWTVQQLVERLADETRRLDELRHGDMGIRPSILLTYQSVTEQARRLFRRLALLEMPVFSGWLSAALLDRPLSVAEDVLDDLISAQLVESAGGGSGVHSQYRFHDLIHVFAREHLAAEEPAAERKAALERALGALLYLADKAHYRYFGGDYARIRCDAPRWPLPERLAEELVSDPLSWYDRERITLLAGVRQAAQAGLVDLSWGLASSIVPLFESRVYPDDWQETHDIALAAAQNAHNVRGQAAMLNSIGSFHLTQQRIEPARKELAEALQLFQETHDEHGMALVARHLAYLDRLSGRLGDATRRYEQALTVLRRIGDLIATAHVLQGLAQVRLELNQLDSAKELLSEALLLCQPARCGSIEAQVLHRMGEAHLQAGEFADAVSAFDLSLAISRAIGDVIGQAYVLQGIGVARVRQAELGQARNALEHARGFAVSAHERLAEARVLLGFSELALASGDPAQAVVFGRQASGMFRSMGALLNDARALTLISEAHAALGDAEAAEVTSTEAAALRAKLLIDAGLSPEVLAMPRASAVTVSVPPMAWQAPAGESYPALAAIRAWQGRGAAAPARPGFRHPRTRRWRLLVARPASQPCCGGPARPCPPS
jgi:DNA-binding SARP family transcriptional activator/tetratricopeptide (TPR) repeat protein